MYFDILSAHLDAVDVFGIEDNSLPNKFEIIVLTTGELLHSMATRGDGPCSTNDEIHALFNAISWHLEKLNNVDEDK
jgi:hypothetical protein